MKDLLKVLKLGNDDENTVTFDYQIMNLVNLFNVCATNDPIPLLVSSRGALRHNVYDRAGNFQLAETDGCFQNDYLFDQFLYFLRNMI